MKLVESTRDNHVRGTQRFALATRSSAIGAVLLLAGACGEKSGNDDTDKTLSSTDTTSSEANGSTVQPSVPAGATSSAATSSPGTKPSLTPTTPMTVKPSPGAMTGGNGGNGGTGPASNPNGNPAGGAGGAPEVNTQPTPTTSAPNPTSAGGAGGGAGEAGGSDAMGGDAPATTGTAPSEPVASGECTRELLSTTTAAYYVALAAHDPSTLPLADGVRFTENGVEMDLGSDGLWKTAGELKYKHSMLDTTACMSVSESVVPDGSTDIPVMLRLALVDGKITEAEHIAVRAGDYVVSGSPFASNTQAIIDTAADIGWETPVPEAQRATYEDLTGWMNKYYRMFPAGVCNVTDDCKRLENGGGSFSCGAGASCSKNDPGPNDNMMTPRLLLGDVETGIGVGFAMFQDNTDMHMFKMYDMKQVHAVHAILGHADSSGWDTK
jgi:hypothetical protein